MNLQHLGTKHSNDSVEPSFPSPLPLTHGCNEPCLSRLLHCPPACLPGVLPAEVREPLEGAAVLPGLRPPAELRPHHADEHLLRLDAGHLPGRQQAPGREEKEEVGIRNGATATSALLPASYCQGHGVRMFHKVVLPFL